MKEAFRKCLFQRWDWSLDLNDEIVAWRSGERAIQVHGARAKALGQEHTGQVLC